MQKLLTEAEVADLLGVKPATVESWRIRGIGPRLPWIKVGRAVRYRLADVERVVAEGTKSTGEAA